MDAFTKARQATYTFEDIAFYASEAAEGRYSGIPEDFDEFIKDKAPTNREELILWLYVCLTRNGLTGYFSREANPKQPMNKSHIDFLYDAFFEEVQDCIVLGNRKGGKCLGKGTPVMLYDGSIKAVEDIQEGDLLMGDDSTSRTVLSTVKGWGPLYRIIPSQGEPYVVNDVHILSLKDTTQNKVIDIPLNEYLQLPQETRQHLKGYKACVAEFGQASSWDVLPIAPYLYGHCLKEYEQTDQGIPFVYKTASCEARQHLLAGIIDSMGWLDERGNRYCLSLTNEQLVDDIIFVVRSLGYSAYKQPADNNHWQFRIYGNFAQLPVKEPCNRPNLNYFPKQDISVVNIAEVEYLGEGEYYGFEITGNRRFLLGDFTVTHNTLVFAALLLLEALFKPGIELAHLGAIKDQATRCYRYFLKMLKHPLFSDMLAKPPTATRTELLNGSVVEILVGTITGVNSPHPHKSQLDEVELMDWEVLQEALNMASSSGGYTGATRLTSTRKYSTGTMQQILDEADAKGFKVYQWNIWDTVEPCRVPKGIESFKILKEEADETQAVYYVSKECLSCELVEVCAGKARYSRGGIIPLKDALRNYKNLDKETWDAQVECLKPGTSDLIFPMFNPNTHVIDYESVLRRRGMWSSESSNRTSFEVVFNPNIEVLAGQDAGYGCPATVFGQMLDDETVVIFDEVYERNLAPSTLINEFLLPKDSEYYVQQWCCDPSGMQLIAEMEIQGLLAMQANNNIATGLDLIRSLLATKRLYITDNCVNLIQELKTYKKTRMGKVAPNQEDHAVDAMRYLLMEMGLFTGIVDEVVMGTGS